MRSCIDASACTTDLSKRWSWAMCRWGDLWNCGWFVVANVAVSGAVSGVQFGPVRLQGGFDLGGREAVDEADELVGAMPVQRGWRAGGGW